MDPRALALFRVGLAVLALVDLARRWPFIPLFYSNDGVLPNHYGLFEPINGWSFSLLWSMSKVAEVQAFFVLGGLALIAFLVGYKTRLTGALSAVVMLSVHARNAMLENGGDVVQQIWWLWSLALPLGQRFSVDALLADLRARADAGPDDLNARPSPDTAPVRRVATVAVFVQLALVYAFNALHKTGSTWSDGVAISYVLEMDKFVTPLGVWLRGVGLPLGLDHALTWGALAIEGAAPLLLLSPWRTVACRRVALLTCAGLHVGIAALLDVGLFSWAMLVGLVALLPAADFDRLGAWARAPERQRLRVFYDVDCGICHATARLMSRLDVRRRLVWMAADAPPPTGTEATAFAERRAREIVVEDTATGRVWGGAEACLRLAAAIPGLGVAPALLWVPGARGRLNAAYARLAEHRVQVSVYLGLPACGLPRAAALAPEVVEPSGLSLWLRTSRARTREVICAVVLGVLLVEAASVNTAVRAFLPFDAPRFVRAFIAYTRTFQSWSMFSPDVPTEDVRLVIDLTLADGTHVDPQTGEAPDFALETAATIPYGQFWGSYAMRLPQERFKAHRGELARWLRRPVQRLHLPPDAQVVALEVTALSDRSPDPRKGEDTPTETGRVVIAQWKANVSR